MERLNEYAEVVKRILTEVASMARPSLGEVEVETVFDDATGHYELQFTGWNGYRRIHGSVVHVDIRGDKVWVQHDGTNLSIADEMIRAGIPQKKIVLGFHHPSKRKLTEFAVQ